VRSAKVVAYPDLGPEAINRLEVENLPLIVGVDGAGGNIYKRLDA
jgi:fumarate hydratase subunit beta